MSFGFPPKRPIFPFLVPISIPFGNGKLAQERTAFAQKRNTMNFLILNSREPPSHAARHQSWAYSRRHPRAPGLRFPLTQPKLSWRIVKGLLGRICATFLGLSFS